MNPTGLQITTPTDTTIVLTRTFHAPRRMRQGVEHQVEPRRAVS